MKQKKHKAKKQMPGVCFRIEKETEQILNHYTKNRCMIRSKVINKLIQKAHADGGI